MNSSLWVMIIIAVLIAAWYGWRYYRLRRHVDEYADRIRRREIITSTLVGGEAVAAGSSTARSAIRTLAETSRCPIHSAQAVSSGW